MYVDADYYKNMYHGIDCGADFDRLNARAQDDIDLATMYSIDESSIIVSDLLLVKKAVCAQIEYYYTNGDTYNDQGGGAESLGSYSYSGTSTKHSALSPRAIQLLEQTGYMSRAVSVMRRRR